MPVPPRQSRLRPPAALLAAAAALAACSVGGDDGRRTIAFDGSDSAVAKALGPGDVAVKSTDGAVMLAVVGDTVRMQLSDSVRAHVRASVDSAAAEAGGVGATIARSVGSAVGSAMGFVVRVPVRDIEEVRYADGRIHLTSRGSNRISMSGSGKGDGRDGARFTQEDGERFVAAVKARQRTANF